MRILSFARAQNFFNLKNSEYKLSRCLRRPVSCPLSSEQSWRYYLLFTSFSQDKIFFFFSPGPGGWRMWKTVLTENVWFHYKPIHSTKGGIYHARGPWGIRPYCKQSRVYIFLNEDPFHLWPQTQKVSLWRQCSGYFSRLLQPYCLWEGQNGDFWKKKYKRKVSGY